MNFYTCPKCGHNGRKRDFAPKADMVERFLYNVDIPEDPEACWLWKGSINKDNGYGYFYPANNTTAVAHRFSYTVFKGEIPGNLFVHHSCRTPRCVNPDHLVSVTPSINLRLH